MNVEIYVCMFLPQDPVFPGPCEKSSTLKKKKKRIPFDLGVFCYINYDNELSPWKQPTGKIKFTKKNLLVK